MRQATVGQFRREELEAQCQASTGARLLLCPRPLAFKDLGFDLFPVRALENQIVSVDGGLHRIANDQAVSGIARMLGKSFTPAKVDNVANLHLIDGVAVGRVFLDSVVRSDVHQLAGLKLMTRRCAQTNCGQKNRKYGGNSNQGY